MKQTNKNLQSIAHNWETCPTQSFIPFQLRDFIEKVITPLKLEFIKNPTRDVENTEYGGASLSIVGKNILFRVAKTTPTKIGQFVALYKKRSRITGKIVPNDINDDFDHVFIAAFNKNYHGVFIFNKEILIKKGIYSNKNKGGKLSFRVYAPWVNTIAPQAKQTQNWQCKYFLSLDLDSDYSCSELNQMPLDFESSKNRIFKQFEKLFERVK